MLINIPKENIPALEKHSDLECLKSPNGEYYDYTLSDRYDVREYVKKYYPKFYNKFLEWDYGDTPYPLPVFQEEFWFLILAFGFDMLNKTKHHNYVITIGENKEEEYPDKKIEKRFPWIWNENKQEFFQYESGYPNLLPIGKKVEFDNKEGIITAYTTIDDELVYYIVETKTNEEHFVHASKIKTGPVLKRINSNN